MQQRVSNERDIDSALALLFSSANLLLSTLSQSKIQLAMSPTSSLLCALTFQLTPPKVSTSFLHQPLIIMALFHNSSDDKKMSMAIYLKQFGIKLITQVDKVVSKVITAYNHSEQENV